MSTIARFRGCWAGSFPGLVWAATTATFMLTSSAAQAADQPDKEKAKDSGKPAAKVSYDKQIRPIFQANCQGCHQPAKAGGKYVMTSFDLLLKGGEAGLPAIVPGKPVESHLVEQITPQGDKAEMPQNKPPLTAAEIELISRWIAQGAENDSSQAASAHYDMAHLPEYTRSPVVGALDFSPDGALLAVGGFHEVLLWKADGSELVGRLVGLSERIESVAFSPDGKKLAVTGGLPARMGEVQVWDVARRKLALSVPVTFDTVYGASWSPDGTKIAFGCADNGVRAIDAKTGAQVLYTGAHNDWALDTTFSVDGSHLVSVGRDMAAKLIEVATQRFVDNITSITPGALKGGLTSVARHPKRDEVVIGGSDGVPKVYRLFRQTVRVIGDDSNLIRELPGLPGRIFSVAVSDDGKRIAAGSSLDGSGEIGIYTYEFDTALPEAIKQIQTKVVTTRSAAEKETLDKYQKEGVKQIADVKVPAAGIYSVAFRPDGKTLAAAGGDGTIRLIETETGRVLKEFAPIAVKPASESVATSAPTVPTRNEAADTTETETFPAGAVLASLDVQPPSVRLTNRFGYVQLVVTAKLASGESIDATRMIEPALSSEVAEVSRSGLIRPKADGKAVLKLTLAGKTVEIPVAVDGLTKPYRADFVHDVAPLLSRLGCNAGTCHGSAQGKNGFKLSLRGYDPIFDVRALTDDHASRRVNVASPDDSLMLLKPTGKAPHVGGVVMQPGDPYHELIRSWIVGGAKLNPDSPKVAKIEVSPVNPTIEKVGAHQQLRVLATYADGEVRDVTREAFLESANTEVAIANRTGVMAALRRGEAPVLARYEGAYASTTMTVMGDRSGFVWSDPPSYGKIDDLVAAKWKRLKIQPSGVCSDAEFIRRASLDLTGLPPTADDVRAFLADKTESRAKREALVDRLIGGNDFVDYWTNKWADLLQVNRKFLDVEGAKAFRDWIRKQVAGNVPYDQFARAVLTASGSNKDNPAASYYKILREPTATMENTTQLFLAVRFNCNKCHDHPFERWTQDQYYQTAAYFAQVGLEADPAGKGKMIGGTSVEAPTPLYEKVSDTGKGEVIHDRTKKVAPPKFPFACDYDAPDAAPRRVELASWITSKDNPYFAKSYVNRLWGYLLGVGIIEPLDDIRAGNPPSNPELLDYLTAEFLKGGFNPRHILRLICTSRTYQLSVESTKWNSDDKTNYSHATARRLPAEVMLDAVYRVTGSSSKFPGVAPGIRAAALPDSGVELPSGFLTTFGRPVRESACECERSSGMQLGPVMALVSGPTLGDAIADPTNALTRLVSTEPDDAKLINDLFLRVLNRPATAAEVDTCRAEFQTVESDHARLVEALGKKEVAFALQRPVLERKRQAAIAKATAAVAAREQELADKLAEQTRQKAATAAKLEADLNAYEAGPLAKKIADWEKANAPAVVNPWAVLVPKEMGGMKGAVTTTQPDGSILVTGDNRNGTLNVTAETDLTDVTGFRIEMIPDDRLPHKGPGRADDGNFVLSEISLSVAPKAAPKQMKVVKLTKPLADFGQDGMTVDKALDGNPATGWAVSPAVGVVHWATFEPEQPVGAAGGSVLTFSLRQNFGLKWNLGRFRISLTRSKSPIGLGLAEDLRTIVATSPEVRSDAQKNALLGYFRAVDAERKKLTDGIAAAKAPIPEDAALKALREQLEVAKQPVPVDSALARLRADVEMSVQQAASRRLTAVQDVAWALINSPAFLFNH